MISGDLAGQCRSSQSQWLVAHGTIDGTIDSQVCFHRRSFANPVKPRQSTTGSMGPLMGTNKAAWGVKLLLTTVSSCQVDCGIFCALLRTWHCCLPPCGWCCPPSASHPPPTPAHSLYTSSLILQELKKPSQKPAVLAV